MSKRILNDKARQDLLKSYKADKLNDAPANISDKTLIENYGSELQKALLEASSTEKGTAEKEQAASTTDQNSPIVEEQPPIVENPNGGIVDGAERVQGVGDYVRLEKQIEPADKVYLDAFNRYIELHNGQAPPVNITLDELNIANEAKVDDLRNKKTATPQNLANSKSQASPNIKSTTLNKNVEKVTLVNNEGKQKRFTKFTYETFMLKDKEWKIAPKAPIEVQALLNQ